MRWTCTKGVNSVIRLRRHGDGLACQRACWTAPRVPPARVPHNAPMSLHLLTVMCVAGRRMMLADQRDLTRLMDGFRAHRCTNCSR